MEVTRSSKVCLSPATKRRAVFEHSIRLRLTDDAPALTRDPRNAGEGMRLGSLEAKYPEEYGGLRAERQGQQKVL
jgi:hypothetical protein